MKIVVLDGYTENPGDLSWSGFEGLGEFTVYDRGSETDKEGEAIARIGDAEIVITNKTPITKRVLDSCPSIRYIGVLATGYNVVDLAGWPFHFLVVWALRPRCRIHVTACALDSS